MKPEAIQKCSSISLELVISLCLLTLAWILGMTVLGLSGLTTTQVWEWLVPGLVLAGLGFVLYSRNGYRVSDTTVELVRPFSCLRILNSTIVKAERVRRSSSRQQYRVRLSYRKGRSLRQVELRPADPAEFLASLLPHCPQLSGTRQRKLARDASFMVAREALPRVRRRLVEDPW